MVATTDFVEPVAPVRIGKRLLGQGLLALAVGYPLLVAPLLSVGSADLDASTNVDAGAANIVNQLFWVVICVATMLCARQERFLRLAWRVWPLTAYLLWSAASVLWAIEPGIVARRWLLQICIITSVLLPIAMIDDAARVRRTLAWVALLVLAVNLASLPIRPPTAIGHPGIYSHKNELGQIAGLMLIVCFYIGAAGGVWLRSMAYMAIPAAGILLVASKSKTSALLAFSIPAIGWTIAWLARITRLPHWAPMLLGLAIALPLGLLYAHATHLTFNRLMTVAFGDTTFTGRTDIWSFAWDCFRERPWLGYGFNGFWGIGESSPALSSGDEFIASILQAHDGYLDILLETGLIGLGLFLTFILFMLLRSRAVIEAGLADGGFVMSLLLFAVVHNIFESTAVRRFHPLWIFMLIAAGLIATARAPTGAAEPDEAPPC